MTIEDDDDLALPAALAAIAAIGFPPEADEDAHGDDERDEPDEDDAPEHPPVDFEPFEEFLDSEDTADWFRGWTGNPDADAEQFRVFGQTADGGYAAFWLVREDAPLAEQPIVFLGPEGETGVVACDLPSFLWLVADGSGPYEAVEHPTRRSNPHPEFTAVAEKHAGTDRMTAREVVAAARDEFPDFEDTMVELSR
ncbi:SMI1/KNR4 family protein [Catenulispora rubra]|uniref:SMI1/KNR4 family protein n=1 Tax=Catenulispora rubra TaxID=280293 RepID=UPI00189213A9|nr:SMI1/KNR4 family protein [Catenulispora rubra]